MKKWVCEVCGYISEDKKSPRKCPVCSSTSENFEEYKKFYSYDNDYKIGVAKDIDEQLREDLRENFSEECKEVGMYLAMSRVAEKDGYKEIAEIYETIAFEEAYHAANFAELLGEVVSDNTKANLKSRIKAEYSATQNKLKLAKRAKEIGVDEVYNTVNNMCKDEAKHSKAFLVLLDKYFDNN
ncbi:MAG: ferritin family protein [Terrisporobacter sp.]